MTHTFLSDEWFAAVEAIGPAPSPPASFVAAWPINIVVTRPEVDDVELNLSDGTMHRGLADAPKVTLTTTFDVARTVFLTGDQHAAMQAFISGQVKVEGDMAKLVAMGRAEPSPEQKAYARAILRLTA